MKRTIAVLAGVSIAAISNYAWAQNPVDSGETKDTAGSGGLIEIVVTAQRRSENLQDVPVSITAADATALAAARVDNISNIQAISPSVNFRVSNNSTSSAKVIIRGVGTTGNNRSFEGSVGVFIDGVYRSRAGAALQDFLDIGNLQILRGPQGTLFGKNTTAGALLLTSAEPDTRSAAYLFDLSYGNYDTIVARAAANVPLSDIAAVRIAGVSSRKDGFFTDASTGQSLNGDETTAIKGQLLLEPSSGTRIRLIGDYSRGSGACCYATANFIDGPTQPLINALTLALGKTVPSDDFQQSLSTPGAQVVKDYGATLLADFEIGAGTLKSVTAWRKFSVDQHDMDADFTGVDIFRYFESFQSRFLSQELTYTTRVDALDADLVLGGFISDEKLVMTRTQEWGSQAQAYWDILLQSRGLPPGTAYAAPGPWTIEDMGGKAKSYAAFAHLDAKLSDRFNVIAGVRYSIEHKRGSFTGTFYRPQPTDVFRLLGIRPGPNYDETTTDRALSGTFGLQYRPSRDVMLYATYNRGFKAGGLNIDANGAGTRANNPAETPGGTPLSAKFRPEKVDAFEIGAKTEYLDRRARTNISFFYYDITDVQVSQYVGLQFAVLNAKSAKDYGVEIENLFQLSEGFKLGLDATWIPHIDFGKDPGIDPALSGTRFRYAPKFQGNATLTMDQPVNSSMNVTGRVQYQYSSSQLLNNASLAKTGSQGVLNTNLGVRFPNLGLLVEAWALNITDEVYPTLSFNTPFQTGDENAYLGAPRTYGFRVRASF